MIIPKNVRATCFDGLLWCGTGMTRVSRQHKILEGHRRREECRPILTRILTFTHQSIKASTLIMLGSNMSTHQQVPSQQVATRLTCILRCVIALSGSLYFALLAAGAPGQCINWQSHSQPKAAEEGGTAGLLQQAATQRADKDACSRCRPASSAAAEPAYAQIAKPG